MTTDTENGNSSSCSGGASDVRGGGGRTASGSREQERKDRFADEVWARMRDQAMSSELIRPMSIHTIKTFVDVCWDAIALAASPPAPADKAEAVPVAWTMTDFADQLRRDKWCVAAASPMDGKYPVALYAALPTPLLREAMEARRIVCAAIRADDGSLLMGIRHYSADMHAQIARMGPGGTRFMHRHDPDQGFVDQHGVYLTREEAYPIAKAAGQIVRPDACRGETLYSEGLY